MPRPRLEDCIKSFTCPGCRKHYTAKSRAHVYIDPRGKLAIACTTCLPRSQALCYSCGRKTVKSLAAFGFRGSYLCRDCNKYMREHPDEWKRDLAKEFGLDIA